jgi:hypothetical protein
MTATSPQQRDQYHSGRTPPMQTQALQQESAEGVRQLTHSLDAISSEIQSLKQITLSVAHLTEGAVGQTKAATETLVASLGQHTRHVPDNTVATVQAIDNSSVVREVKSLMAEATEVITRKVDTVAQALQQRSRSPVRAASPHQSPPRPPAEQTGATKAIPLSPVPVPLTTVAPQPMTPPQGPGPNALLPPPPFPQRTLGASGLTGIGYAMNNSLESVEVVGDRQYSAAGLHTHTVPAIAPVAVKAIEEKLKSIEVLLKENLASKSRSEDAVQSTTPPRRAASPIHQQSTTDRPRGTSGPVPASSAAGALDEEYLEFLQFKQRKAEMAKQAEYEERERARAEVLERKRQSETAQLEDALTNLKNQQRAVESLIYQAQAKNATALPPDPRRTQSAQRPVPIAPAPRAQSANQRSDPPRPSSVRSRSSQKVDRPWDTSVRTKPLPFTHRNPKLESPSKSNADRSQGYAALANSHSTGNSQQQHQQITVRSTHSSVAATELYARPTSSSFEKASPRYQATYLAVHGQHPKHHNHLHCLDNMCEVLDTHE